MKFLAIIVLLAVFLISGCATNPGTGQILADSSPTPQYTTIFQEYVLSPSQGNPSPSPTKSLCTDVQEAYTEQQPYTTSVPYTTQEPYQDTEYYTETESYEVPKQTEWVVEWNTLSGSLVWGGKVGDDKFTPTFSYDKGKGIVYSVYSDYIGFTGYATINIELGGIYTFTIGADDGAILRVDGKTVIDNKFSTGGRYSETSSDVTLEKGKHNLFIQYYEKEGDAKVVFKASNDDIFSWKEIGYKTVQKSRPVTKYRDVTKYKEETKYQTITK